jgi:uncharacterized protein HemX
MSQFERDLRESLKRREPPPGFAERVLAHTFATEKPGFFGWRGLVAVAAMVMLLVGGGFYIQEQRRQAELQAQNEQKKEQLMASLRIAGAKLRFVEERLGAIRDRTINFRREQE